MNVKVKVDGTEYTVSYDATGIKRQLTDNKECWEPELYVPNGMIPGDPDGFRRSEYIKEEGYIRNLNVMIDKADAIATPASIEQIIKDFPKKKNGDFYKRRINELATCENSMFSDEYCPCWHYLAITARSHDGDRILSLRLEEIKKNGSW